MIGNVKNGPFERGSDFRSGIEKIAIIRENKMISITLRQIP